MSPGEIDQLFKLDLLEFHVVHHCNLTCMGCAHFAPTAPRWFAHPEQFCSEVQLAARKLLPTYVHILGGEPLLHPELHELLNITRSTFVRSVIKIVTNGLLFPHASPELLSSMAENDVQLAVSLYPRVRTNQELIVEICRAYRITLEFWPQETFLDFINPMGDTDPVTVRAKCPMAGATTVRDGRLYPCPVTAWADFAGSELCESDGIDLSESITRLASVLDPHRITSRCRFCRVAPDRVPHTLSKPP